MAEVKSHEFEGFLQKSVRHYRIFVVYGPDRGLVAERAAQIAATTGVDLSDNFALIRLDVGDITSDPGRLMDEVNSFGLFGGDKLVWIRGAANEKALVDGLQIIVEAPPENSTVLIEAGDLKKGSALRKVAEAARSIAIVPCYQDDARAINALIDTELSGAGQRITPAARELLTESLGGDRIASRSEVRKLLLYCLHEPIIDEQHVVDIIGDASAISTDEVVDAVLSGDPDGFLHALQKIVTSKTPVFLVLQSCLRQFQQLELMRIEMEDRQQQAGQVIQSLGRGIHFRRKPLIERALRNWNATDLAREASRIQATILQTRKKAALEDKLAMQTLLSTTLQSARRNRRA
ncbi:DNA polymerase III subunit delta [Ciceribacter naphthalenivorans]|uniref:DNA polymerase III subunit delta n=3 Tax=Alphaproteobacteria TaxID=28211 RepID=A0A512HMD4_9HYPH|nr:DNA polymerase III subunit delta [Ciceribacter naphthalenivorans]GEO86603.1 DNA polymerase III subunit delta [Ciceribacter naphthalenivorans]GLR20825.1 DNA polymerase III subunit delta [Ciceribacter naphthalenivorans]GLT03681.1 DNA polymerase III subunit delta [Sphingomonas psychrolutea]